MQEKRQLQLSQGEIEGYTFLKLFLCQQAKIT